MNTAAEKLMMLSDTATCALFVNHMKLRAAKGEIDPDVLEKCSNELGQIAHTVARKQA